MGKTTISKYLSTFTSDFGTNITLTMECGGGSVMEIFTPEDLMLVADKLKAVAVATRTMALLKSSTRPES